MSALNKIYCGLKSKACPACKTTIADSRTRQIHRWAADPDTTESHQRNPVDRYETLLNKLMALGHIDIARSSVRRQARIVGCFLRQVDMPRSDKSTIAEECLDDLAVVADYHKVLNDPDATPELVRERLAAAELELRENYDRFCRERGILA